MALFDAKKKHAKLITREQALACIPVQNNVISWTTLDSGAVQIKYAMVLKPLLRSIFRRFSADSAKTPTRKIELDELGSTVWKKIDGKRSTAEIIREFAAEQNISVQEAEQSITLFFRELGKRGLIGLG